MEERIQLKVQGLVKRFGTETVLNDIDLCVHKGEVVVVMGILHLQFLMLKCAKVMVL